MRTPREAGAAVPCFCRHFDGPLSQAGFHHTQRLRPRRRHNTGWACVHWDAPWFIAHSSPTVPAPSWQPPATCLRTRNRFSAVIRAMKKVPAGRKGQTSGLRSISKTFANVCLKIHVFQANVRERFAYWMQPIFQESVISQYCFVEPKHRVLKGVDCIWSCGDLNVSPLDLKFPELLNIVLISLFCRKKVLTWYTEMQLWLWNCIFAHIWSRGHLDIWTSNFQK